MREKKREYKNQVRRDFPGENYGLETKRENTLASEFPRSGFICIQIGIIFRAIRGDETTSGGGGGGRAEREREREPERDH